MEYTVNGLAKLAGVSARTLRYYDEIGLLKPCRAASSGYRIYGPAEVDALQQILFYRDLGVGLSEVAELVSAPDYNRLAALREHLAVLQGRRKELELLIKNVRNTIYQEEGAIVMKDEEKFEGLKKRLVEENEEKYGSELREKYGRESIEQSNQKLMGLTQEQYDRMQTVGGALQRGLEEAVRNGLTPNSPEGARLAAMHKEWLGFTWPQYSREAHNGLVQMYTQDERFTAYYDKEVPGCAAFLCGAVLAME